MTKIAITDDHPLLLEGLKNILSREDDLEVVGIYADSASLHEALASLTLDVLLLDINLPDANSLELISPMKLNYPQMKIIIISVHNEFAVINSALQQGAEGYIQKNASVEEIIAGISEVVNGHIFLCTQTKGIIDKKTKDEL